MALSNQPYLPLYVNDWLGNTKLRSCSALAHGVMINVMLLMHKEADYGIILLKQKYKQSDKQVLNFASQFAKVLPFDLLELQTGLSELIEEKSLEIDGELLVCRRMVKDADISKKRAQSGSKGGSTTMQKPPKIDPKFAQANNQAKTEANSVNVIDIINENIIEYKRDEIFEKSIMKFWNFNEIANPDKQLLISQFCQALYNQNQLEDFKKQFKAYCEYKIANGFKHNFNKFLGSQSECFGDGAWNDENWEAKLKEVKPTSTATPGTVKYSEAPKRSSQSI